MTDGQLVPIRVAVAPAAGARYAHDQKCRSPPPDGRPDVGPRTGVPLSLLLGFLAGAGVERITQADSSPSRAVPSSPTAGNVPSGGAPSPAIPTSSAPTPAPVEPPTPAATALPDPSKPAPRVAYLGAIQQAGVPVGDRAELLLEIGGEICQTPAEKRSDPPTLARSINTLFGRLWTPEQAASIVQAAEHGLC